MSHYIVAVISDTGRDYDELLLPYGEENEEYFAFHAVDEKTAMNLKKSYDADAMGHERDSQSFEEFLKEQGYVIEGDTIGYVYNENSKWDWYMLNARNNYFTHKNGVDDPERLSDYVFDTVNRLKPEQRKGAEQEWKLVTGQREPANKDERSLLMYSTEYMREKFPTLEDYLIRYHTDAPYAYITPDGEWHAPGEVGYFGLSDETPESYKKYVKEWLNYAREHPDKYVSFVDCHI